MQDTLHLKKANVSSKLRRSGLLEAMKDLKKSNIGCAGCPGTCCTFVANSMQVTPLEALDLYNFLKANNRIGDELWIKLEENIEEFRLDKAPHVGAGRSFRRTYTCPFFAGKSLGCTIEPKSKPYGCLAFNASESDENTGKSCSSDIDLLSLRENCLGPGLEEEQNREIQQSLGISWNKESIPVALMDLRTKLDSL